MLTYFSFARKMRSGGLAGKEQNAGDFRGVDAAGGTLLDPPVATVEGGKIKPVILSDLLK